MGPADLRPLTGSQGTPTSSTEMEIRRGQTWLWGWPGSVLSAWSGRGWVKTQTVGCDPPVTHETRFIGCEPFKFLDTVFLIEAIQHLVKEAILQINIM